MVSPLCFFLYFFFDGSNAALSLLITHIFVTKLHSVFFSPLPSFFISPFFFLYIHKLFVCLSMFLFLSPVKYAVCLSGTRRILRSRRPQEIFQPPQRGFFSVHALLQLLGYILRLFTPHLTSPHLNSPHT